MSMPEDEGPQETLTVAVPSTLMRNLEKEVPSHQMSAFVAKALEAALDDRGQQRALRSLWSIQPFSTNGEDSVEVLRRQRREFEESAWKA